jgi:hypothetical protein
MGMRSWGFTVERHDFGGACLVQSVELLSPAEAAMIVGCPEEHYSYKSSLRVNDMILSINGKSGKKKFFFSTCCVRCCVMKRFESHSLCSSTVGGMTLVDFSIELELSGFELVLVLARYKQEESYFHSSQPQGQLYPHSLVEPNRTNAVKGNTNTSKHADNISRLHWIEISPDIHTNDASIFAPDPMLHSKADGVSDENLEKESDKMDVQKEPRHHDSMNDTNGLFDRMSSSLGEVEQTGNHLACRNQ